MKASLYSQPGALETKCAGVAAAVFSYIIWGTQSFFWKLLTGVGAWEVIAQRYLWSVVLLGAVIFLAGRTRELAGTLSALWRDKASLGVLFAVSALAFVNWWLTAYAPLAGCVVELGTGYFLTPLMTVMIGLVFFKESLGPLKLASLALGLAAVIFLIGGAEGFPWVALGVSSTWAVYGALKKYLFLEPLEAIFLESAAALPAAILICLEAGGAGHYLGHSAQIKFLLATTSVVTCVPLITFTFAANHLSLSALGFCQYISPALTVLVGVFCFGEPFGKAQAVPLLLIAGAVSVFILSEILDPKDREGGGIRKIE